MRRILNRIYRWCDRLASFAILLLTVIVVAQILARLGGVTVPGAHEAAEFLLASAIYLALAYTLVVGGHIRVTLILERLRSRARWWVEIWCHVISMYLIGYLAVFSVLLVVDSWQSGQKSEGLVAIPIFIPQIAMAFGVCMLFVRLLDQLVELLQTGTVREVSEQPDLPGGFT